MANGTVGIQQPATPDRLVDNTATNVDGITVHRQRVDLVPSRTSAYQAGVAGSVAVATSSEIVAVSCLAGSSASTVVIAGGASIPVPAGVGLDIDLADAPIAGTGPGCVVFTGTVTYFVRTRDRIG